MHVVGSRVAWAEAKATRPKRQEKKDLRIMPRIRGKAAGLSVGKWVRAAKPQAGNDEMATGGTIPRAGTADPAVREIARRL
jgi:hypothetical protein